MNRVHQGIRGALVLVLFSVAFGATSLSVAQDATSVEEPPAADAPPTAETPPVVGETAEEPADTAADDVLDSLSESEDAEPKTAEPEAAVEATAEPTSSSKGAHYLVIPHVGISSPQLFSELGSWPIFGLELGYIVPADIGGFVRPIQLGFDVQYTQPSASGAGISPNLGVSGAAYDWELDQRMLILELNFAWRFMAIDEFLSAYAQAGPRVYLMESVLTAKGNGADFGENTETNTEYGGMVAGGLDILLGPGSFFGALEFGYSQLEQTITGSANTGALALDLGYRFHF